MQSHVVLPVSENSQIGDVRRVAVQIADEAGFPETEKGQVAIVATELATNLVRHAQHGQMLLRLLPSDEFPDGGFEFVASDRFPGSANFGQCFVDGYSTAGTLGQGLGAVKRLSRVFDFYSAPNQGTVVLSHVAARRDGPSPAETQFEWGAISVSAPYETVCGDAWRIKNENGNFHVIVADGLGHGPIAAEAAGAACNVFRDSTSIAPKSFLEQAHARMTATRGAAVAVASTVGFRDGTLEILYAGVGNISGAIHAPDGTRGLISYNGIVGSLMRSVHQLRYAWPTGSILIMHSDGLKTRWSLNDYPGLIRCHPAVIAAVLVRDHYRGKDDASIVVVRQKSLRRSPSGMP